MKRPFFVIFIIFSVLFGTNLLLLNSKDRDLFGFLLKNGDYVLNLVTKENTLSKYTPNDLVELSGLGAPRQFIRKIAFSPLANLLEAAAQENLGLKILSAYRSYTYQNSLFNSYRARNLEANRFSAEAGHSEHQLGTAIDFGIGDKSIDFTEAFDQTKAGVWLNENAWKYGFVLSYPASKEKVTGYTHEPWHYRFIGQGVAREWHRSGLTLKEFLLTKPQFYHSPRKPRE